MFTQDQVFKKEFYPADSKFEQSFFLKWLNIGDKAYGTFHSLYTKLDEVKMKEEVYCVMRCAQGCVVNVYVDKTTQKKDMGGKLVKFKANVVTLKQLEGVVPGQVIGVEYVADIPMKKPGWSPAKSLAVIKPKDENGAYLVDKNEQAALELKNQFGGVVEQPDFGSDIDSQTASGPVDIESQIRDLALLKLPLATVENWKEQVMEATQKAYIKGNYEDILSALKAMA